jgi:hypothetical protein
MSKQQDQRKKLLLIGGGILAVLALIVALLAIGGFNFFALVNADHHYNTYNQSWTISSNWGDNQNRQCHELTSDQSNDQNATNPGLIAGIISTTNDRTICDFNDGITISLDGVDLTNYSKVVIHRNGYVRISTIANAAGGSTSISGLQSNPAGNPVAQQSIATNGQLSVGRAGQGSIILGDVTIVRSGGQTIVFANPEAPAGYVLADGQPYHFSTSISGGSDGTIQESLVITGIDLTPLPPPPPAAPVAQPLPPGPVVNQLPPVAPMPSTLNPPSPQQAQSLYQSFINAIASFWHWLTSLIGVSS